MTQGIVPDQAEAGIALRLLGEPWWVDLSAYDDAAALRAHLAELWGRAVTDGAGASPTEFRPSPAPDAASTPRAPRLRVSSPEAFPYAFSGALTRAVIDRRVGTAMLLHAAGLVSEDESRAVVLVAPSGTGKSTAARALGRYFGYLSDELVAIESDQTLSAYPKPISIIVPGFPGGKDEFSPDALGLADTPAGSPRLSALVRLSRDPDREGPPALVRTDIHEALGELTAQSSSIWRIPHPLQQLAAAAARAGGPYRLEYSEIEEAVPLIRGLFDAAAAAGTDWIAHEPVGDGVWAEDVAPAASRPDAAEAVTRTPWTDALEADGDISVLRGSRLTRLAGIGATVWRELAQPRSIEELIDLAIAEHGDHPEADARVRAVVTELAANSLITVG